MASRIAEVSADSCATAPRTRLLLRIVGACALIAAAIAASGLIGWLFNLPAVRSLLPHAVEMKANTAVALLIASASLWARSVAHPMPRRLGVLLAVAVALIGAVTLIEYLFGWRAGIDQVLFQDNGNAFNSFRGRMSPYSATAFLALGLALAPPPRRSLRPLLLSGGFVVAAIGFSSAVGYSWNAAELTTDQWLPPVALNTAVALLLLGIGSMFVDAAVGHRMPRARIGGSIERKVLLSFLAAFALLCLSGGFTYRKQAQFAHTAQALAAGGAVPTPPSAQALSYSVPRFSSAAACLHFSTIAAGLARPSPPSRRPDAAPTFGAPGIS